MSQLQVINKEWVEMVIYDRPYYPGNNANEEYTQKFVDTVNPSKIYWFQIGNVDSFERSLRKIEEELNIEPSNQLSIIYKNKITYSIQ